MASNNLFYEVVERAFDEAAATGLGVARDRSVVEVVVKTGHGHYMWLGADLTTRSEARVAADVAEILTDRAASEEEIACVLEAIRILDRLSTRKPGSSVWLTTQEVAEELDVFDRNVITLIKSGALPATKAGHGYLVHSIDLAKYIAARDEAAEAA